MYRLLLWSLMFWTISRCAMAQEGGSQQPHRLQPGQVTGRPIEHANAQASLRLDDPSSFQGSAQLENRLRTTPVQASAETPIARDDGSRAASNLNTELSVAQPGSHISER